MELFLFHTPICCIRERCTLIKQAVFYKTFHIIIIYDIVFSSFPLLAKLDEINKQVQSVVNQLFILTITQKTMLLT